jgi:hypothetical protein
MSSFLSGITAGPRNGYMGLQPLSWFFGRLAESSDVHALYETACLMEHSCIPNVKFTFDDKYQVNVAFKVINVSAPRAWGPFLTSPLAPRG